MKKKESKAVYWIIAATVVVLLIPIFNVAVDYVTFIHPWRAELAGSILLGILVTAAYGDADIRDFLAGIQRAELRLLILPCAAFIIWSAVSAIWARSAAFALYQASVWICYLAFYALFRYYLRDEKALDLWMVGMMALLWIVGLEIAAECIAELAPGTPKIAGMLYSKYTELANTLVPLVAAHALRKKGTPSILAFGTVIFVWLFDNATQSRTGVGMFVIEIAALVLVTLIIPSLRQYRAKTAALGITLLAVSIIGGLVFLGTTGSVPISARVADPGIADSTDTRPFFLKIALQMWREDPVKGVGADNFGVEFSRYRKDYAQRVPDDPLLRLSDDDVPERAHNEYAQILAELGAVGMLIFAVFLAGVALCAFYMWRACSDISLNTTCALIGVAAFLASSLVTSYSFRLFQNGLAFFFVLAIAVAGTMGKEKTGDRAAVPERAAMLVGYAMLIALVSCVFLGGYCFVRVAAVYEMRTAIDSKTVPEKNRHFERAIKLDPSNAIIYRAAGLTRLNDNDTAGAAAYLRQAIDHGLASSTEYSFLATSQLVGMNGQAASQTIDEALLQFPRSTFLHVRSGVLNKALGRIPESERQFQIANDLDSAQAATWRAFLETGAAKATQSAKYSNGLPVTSLKPAACIAAVQKEREMLFPDEKIGVTQ